VPAEHDALLNDYLSAQPPPGGKSLQALDSSRRGGGVRKISAIKAQVSRTLCCRATCSHCGHDDLYTPNATYIFCCLAHPLLLPEAQRLQHL
jgi:hypothetical protein